jgi:hypothetical protein
MRNFSFLRDVAGGTIDSLIIEGYGNCFAAVTNAHTSSSLSTSSIRNCINNATIYIVNGIVGSITRQNNNGCFVLNCINNGDISGTLRLGGIAGDNEGTILHCINTGSITATEDNIGGIFGFSMNAFQEVTGCINTGNVKGNQNVGGITGRATSG